MQYRQFAQAALTVGAFFFASCTSANSYPAPNPKHSPQGQVAAPNPQTCAAKDLQYLVGQSRTVLHTMRFGGEVRFEEPGQMHTQEYSPTRTRFIIGENGKIAQILCG